MSDGRRDAIFAARFGLREILSATWLETTMGASGGAETVVELVPDVGPVVVVDECFAALASALAAGFASFASALAVPFALLAVNCAALTSAFVVGFVVGFAGFLVAVAAVFATLTGWTVCAAGFVTVAFAGFTPFGAAVTRT